MLENSGFLLEKNITNKTYHNTKLLLHQYKAVLWRIKQDITDMQDTAIEKGYDELYNYIDLISCMNESTESEKLERRLSSMKDSKIILDFIDRAVIILRDYPHNGKLYYEILTKTYLNFYPYSENEMLENYNFSRATYYREKKKAVGMLGIVLWGFVIPEYQNQVKKSQKVDTKLIPV